MLHCHGVAVLDRYAHRLPEIRRLTATRQLHRFCGRRPWSKSTHRTRPPGYMITRERGTASPAAGTT